MLVGVYVDDIVISHNNQQMYDDFAKLFANHFPCRLLGRLDYFLGIAVDQRDDGSISINQTQLVLRLGTRAALPKAPLHRFLTGICLDTRPARRQEN